MNAAVGDDLMNAAVGGGLLGAARRRLSCLAMPAAVLSVAVLGSCLLGATVLAAGARAAAPVLGETWSTDVASGSASLQAQVNPEGAQTTYRFEYGTSSAYGASIPIAGGGAGSGTGLVTVQAHVQDLQPNTTYHYRIVVSNADGTVSGTDHTFMTEVAGGTLTLLDGRQWEMVSSLNKHGAGFEAISREGGVIQAAVNGDGISYIATGPVTSDPEGSRSPEVQQILSKRGTSGWVTQDIASPHEAARGLAVGEGGEYRLFSPDLSLAVVQPRGLTPLSPETTEWTPYLRDDASGKYLPLVTAGNVLAGTEFGGDPNDATGNVKFIGASADLSHLLLGSNVPLTTNADVEIGLYEWSAGKLQFVNVLPGPGEEPEAGSPAGVRNSISADGSRVVWRNFKGTGRIYLRDMTKSETLLVDKAQGGPEEAESTFETASSDDSKIFFTSLGRLTPGALPGALYECEVVEGAGKLACNLRDLTTPENPGEDVGLQGVVLGASEDGSYVYFVATGVLAKGAQAGQHNLYVSHAGTTTLVAVLAEDDAPWSETAFFRNLGRVTARVSPNGKFLAFMSDRSLTGYDNRDALSGEPDEEVYLYDAESNHLTCASCNPSGARPNGLFETEEFPGPLVDRVELWQRRWLAGSLPGWTKVNLGSALYQSRYLSDSGRLFFDSSDALVAQDINGFEDVYEYEPGGVGGCTSSSASGGIAFKAAHESEVEGREVQEGAGCVGLISSGSAAGESAFLDASEAGGDVFFLTEGQLVEQDKDNQLDVYDAHLCGAEGVPCSSVLAAPPACVTADSCRGAVAPQPGVFGAPASATFAGAGNPMPVLSTPASKGKPKAKAKRRGKGKGKHKRKQGKGSTRGRKGRRAVKSKRPARRASVARTGR